MADDKESIFDRAEGLLRKTFERIGAKVDSKITPATEETFNAREIGDIISKLERAVDTNLQADSNGVKRLAPNYFKVLVTYERAASLNRMHTDALCKELQATVYEYIRNRRYDSKGQLRLVIARDLFEKSTAVQAGFDNQIIAVPLNELLAPRQIEEPKPTPESRVIVLRDEDGSDYGFELKIGAAPACLGRASGNRLRIDDQSISRIHCSFTVRGDGKVFIADLNSSNGTSINGNPLHPNEACEFKAGDVIVAGDIKLTVVEVA